MRLYDGYPHAVYRVVCRNSLPDGRVQLDTWNVKAQSPSVAAEWVISWRARGRYSEILTAYKLRRQPVWLKKAGQLDARFDLRKRELFRPTPL